MFGLGFGLDTTLENVLAEPMISKSINASLAAGLKQKIPNVTLAQVLALTGGFRQFKLDDVWQFAWALENISRGQGAHAKDHGPMDMKNRGLYLAMLVECDDFETVGSFAYSSDGYILVGHLMELASGTVYEELIRKEVFEPLCMTEARIGLPGADCEADSLRKSRFAWGRRTLSGVGLQEDVDPAGVGSDKPRVFGPAGRVSVSVVDLARFLDVVADFEAASVKLGISEEAWRRWREPYAGQPYSVGAWLVYTDPNQTLLVHTGSNTMWYSRVIIDVSSGTFVVGCTNSGLSGADVGAVLMLPLWNALKTE